MSKKGKCARERKKYRERTQNNLAFLKGYDIIAIIFRKEIVRIIMDDGDSNADNPHLYRKFVQVKRSPHLRM